MDREVTIKLGPGRCALIISDQLASQYRVWSDPVQMMVEPKDGDHDVLDVTLRRYECAVCERRLG